jgi:hypothetical protein
MNLGFETCGNATLIAYDAGIPVLTTDPWLHGAQYFGSWTLPFRFTASQQEAFAAVRHVWLSHGHPDHLNLESLATFRDKTLLVPDHRGDRILSDLKAAGYRVQVLANNSWTQLSPSVRILCCADQNQDAALLLALGEHCAVLNLNDGSAIGNRLKLKAHLKPFTRRFVLKLLGGGGADMINYFTEAGQRIAPMPAERTPLGLAYNRLLNDWEGTHTAPFSCHHAFARTDSRWAAEYETPIDMHGRLFKSEHGEFIPGYFAYDVATDRIAPTPMAAVPREFHDPREFGDDWSEPLETAEVKALSDYFRKFEHLGQKFQFLNFRVGGRDHFVDLGGPRGRGITFEAPRHSLLTAVRYEIFDDLLIGNFVQTTMHGEVRSLYPDFTPYVAKYGDNGRAFSREQLDAYFRSYREKSNFHEWLEQVRVKSNRKVRRAVLATLATTPMLYRTARSAYRRFMI